MGEIQKYDDILQSYSNKEQVGKNGDVMGIVKDINYDLKNPIMTIISDKPKVEGTFAEDDLRKVKEGMEVKVTSNLFKDKIDGTLTKIAKYPAKTPSEEKESRFPFEVELNEGEYEVFHGTHVDVSIVTDQVLDATTVSKESVLRKSKNSSYLYVLNSDGLIEKRKINSGLSLNGRIEIQKGIKKDDIIVQNANSVKKAGKPFFTPLKIEHLSRKSFSKESALYILKYIGISFSKI
jgi:HlyD family secretion protein